MEDIDVGEGGYYEDVNDEDEQELLRGLPCAFDESAPLEADTLHTTSISSTLCEPTKGKSLLEEEQRGVVNFPPLHGSSFMLRGDNGIVRWVTTRTRTQHNHCTRKSNDAMTSAVCEADDVELQISSDDDEEDDMELHVLRLQQAQRAAHTTKSANASSTTELGLLGVESMSYLMHEVYESLAQDQQRKEAQQVQGQQHEESRVQLSTSSLTNANSGALWVDKYAPRRFRDILSDDAMSLQLLQWLKSWEDYVFGSAHKATTTTSISEGVASSSSNDADEGHKIQAALPEERIAVLVGPPGVGKTTLVHVLAKHCGYEVIEVNASMERTTTRLESTIKMAISAMPTPAALQQIHSSRMEGNSNIGDVDKAHTTGAFFARKRSRDAQEGTQLTQRNMNDSSTNGDTSSVTLVQHLLRPKCLVLDEMDGIAGNVATFLLEQDIHRPVFCLCNDWYAPALRPLRQRCSHVFRLPPVKAQRLLGRLSYIAASEGVALESAALAELVRVSNGDIRSCINTLQFLVTALRHHSSSSSKNITAGQMLRTLQGKDAVFDVWQTWASVFQRRDRARSVLLLQQEYGIDYDALRVQATTQTGSSTSAQLTPHSNTQHNNNHGSVVDGFHVDPGYLYLAHTLARTTGSTTTTTTTGNTSASNGMSSLLLDGLQENYLQRPYLDYSFSRTARLARGFAEYDVLFSTARLRAASLIPFAERYESCVALLTHVLCSSTTQTTSLSFPRLQVRLYERKTAVSHIARSFQHGTAHHQHNHHHDALPAYLTNNEVLVCDIGPMLTRCLYDTALHFPMHAATMAMLPAAMQHFIEQSVARHISYGLTYEQSRHYDTSANELGFGASVQGTQSGRSSWSQQRQQTNTTTTASTTVAGVSPVGSSEPHWHLVPEMDLFVRAGSHDERRWMPSEELKAFMVGEIARQAVRQRALMRSAAQHSHMAGHFIEASESHVPKKTEDKAETPVKTETLIADKDNKSTSNKAVQEKAKQTGTPSTSPTGTAPPVKRDFFGRPIVTPDTTSSHNTNRSINGSNSLLSLMNGTLGMKRTHSKASSLGSSGALSHAQNRPKVRYVYHDGATNAVKMDATFQDFA